MESIHFLISVLRVMQTDFSFANNPAPIGTDFVVPPPPPPPRPSPLPTEGAAAGEGKEAAVAVGIGGGGSGGIEEILAQMAMADIRLLRLLLYRMVHKPRTDTWEVELWIDDPLIVEEAAAEFGLPIFSLKVAHSLSVGLGGDFIYRLDSDIDMHMWLSLVTGEPYVSNNGVQISAMKNAGFRCLGDGVGDWAVDPFPSVQRRTRIIRMPAAFRRQLRPLIRANVRAFVEAAAADYERYRLLICPTSEDLRASSASRVPNPHPFAPP